MSTFKQRSVRVLSLAVMLFAAGFMTPAQRGTSIVQRVSFPRGRTTAVLHGTVRRGVSNDYLLRARAYQTMTVHLSAPRDVNFSILSPTGESVADFTSDWSGELQESGDYRINVLPPTRTGAPAQYTLEVTIR